MSSFSRRQKAIKRIHLLLLKMSGKEKVIDISWPLTKKATSYRNRSLFNLSKSKTFQRDHKRETKITLSSHSGTHIDAQSHFLENGKTIDQYDLHKLVGNCRVLDFTKLKKRITATDLKPHKIKKNEIILLKTHNSFHTETDQFDEQFVYLSPSGATYLKEKKVKAVGIDYLGIERGDIHHNTHRTLLKAEIPIIEGLRLAMADTKKYYFVCLPLAIQDIDAAPARAILIEK